MVEFAKKLKQLREWKGWSQEELAKRLGVSRSKIGNYEQGTREPDFESLEAIADVFNCSLSFLIESGRLGPDEWYNVKEVAYLNEAETDIIEKYRTLNFRGKNEVSSYVNYIFTRPEYHKELKSDASSEIS